MGGPLMASALFGSIPVALLYSVFVECYVSSLTGAEGVRTGIQLLRSLRRVEAQNARRCFIGADLSLAIAASTAATSVLTSD